VPGAKWIVTELLGVDGGTIDIANVSVWNGAAGVVPELASLPSTGSTQKAFCDHAVDAQSNGMMKRSNRSMAASIRLARAGMTWAPAAYIELRAADSSRPAA